MNKINWSTEYLHEVPTLSNQQHYLSKVELEQQNIMYPVSPFYNTSPSESPNSMIYHDSFITSPPHSSFQLSAGPGSPDSFMTNFTTAPVYPQLVQSTSTSTTSSAATTAYLNETIAKASALPESFYPEFLQYSKESFEQSTNRLNNKKRNRSVEQSCSDEEDDEEDEEDRPTRKQKTDQKQDSKTATVSELRRQIHIQSEQKRRAQIKDGFEELRNELPACLNKKMSKVTLLHRTVQHIQHLKSTQMTILAELERLAQENEQLRNFQQSVLQKQALENMYSIGKM